MYSFLCVKFGHKKAVVSASNDDGIKKKKKKKTSSNSNSFQFSIQNKEHKNEFDDWRSSAYCTKIKRKSEATDYIHSYFE